VPKLRTRETKQKRTTRPAIKAGALEDQLSLSGGGLVLKAPRGGRDETRRRREREIGERKERKMHGERSRGGARSGGRREKENLTDEASLPDKL